MISTPHSSHHPAPDTDRTVRGGIAARLLDTRLRALRHGEIQLEDGDHVTSYGQRDDTCALSVTLRVLDRRFYGEVVYGGSVGAGEAYMSGYWTVSDLTALVRILLCNRELLDGLEGSLARFSRPLRKLMHWAHRGTRRGARRNVAAHYDLGNDLFAVFLDQTMMYSCALFADAHITLQAAQSQRLGRICRKLQLSPGDHLLEIGTGWGGLALHAAEHYGCKVTTTTVSRQQYEFTVQRVQAAGLVDRITVLQEDYRDLRGRFDKLVSIEMIEAVGHRYLDTYFRQCAHLLEPHGSMLLQAITIADRQYESARREVDFIQKHIFPGSCIPSVSALCNSIARSSDFTVRHLEDIGPHYAITLRHWRENFFRGIDRVRMLGYSESFIRMWEFYLCYCEGGFEERVLGDVQMLLCRSAHRADLQVPALGER